MKARARPSQQRVTFALQQHVLLVQSIGTVWPEYCGIALVCHGDSIATSIFCQMHRVVLTTQASCCRANGGASSVSSPSASSAKLMS